MSNFINIDDYDASIHNEILGSLTRYDSNLLEICEDRAIAEMRCYLSGRYDCDAIFNTTPGHLASPSGSPEGTDAPHCASPSGSPEGTDPRHQLILMMALDIAIYHIFSIHNPMKLSQLRKDRYERAIEWLKAVAAGTISIEGAPLAPVEVQVAHQPFRIVSNSKRHNHF